MYIIVFMYVPVCISTFMKILLCMSLCMNTFIKQIHDHKSAQQKQYKVDYCTSLFKIRRMPRQKNTKKEIHIVFEAEASIWL